MKISVIGIGHMGSGFAEGLIKAGYDVIVYDRTEEKTKELVKLGAKPAKTAGDAIAESDATIIVVPDADAVRAVLLEDETKGSLSNAKILNASTTTAEEIIQISEDVAAHNGVLSEISMLIGADELRSQQGLFLLGCDEKEKNFWNDILSKVGTAHYVGAVGDASKAESPMLFGSVFISMTVAYSCAMALKLNVPQDVITQQLAMFVPHAEYMIPAVMARDYSQVNASVSRFKDVCDTAISAAKSVNIPTKILEDIKCLYLDAEKSGYGEQDGMAIVETMMKDEHIQ
jgi:3-hydroxyisobutyrate dehydrogenase